MYITDSLAIIAIIFLIILLAFEFKRNVTMLQQNSYRPERYYKWLRLSGDSTSYPRLIGIFIFLFCLSSFNAKRVSLLILIVFAICLIALLAKKKYKKPLVYTKRVIRILTVIALQVAIVCAGALLITHYGLFGKTNLLYAGAVTLLFVYVISHIFIFSTLFVLSPVERHINNKFYKSAKNKLAGMPDLKIIGITGSYGKTSTKHYLFRILNSEYETLMTPGSFNTTLGVVRTVNEYLKPYHEAFIVEMGAKQKGDIKEICDLVKPSIGIITAVGPQHLETFKTIENVRDTKFELVDSLPHNGLAVLDNDYEIIAKRQVNNCHSLRYGCENVCKSADYVATDIKYTQSGTIFKLQCPDGQLIEFETPLLGEYNISNLVAAIITAHKLGVPEDKIKISVGMMEPVEHRLEIRRFANGLTIIDDAFNSNPKGASMAVEVLKNMTGGRRIIITPGMIELGEEQYRLNKEFGYKIAGAGIEYTAIVGHYNKEAILEGLTEGGCSADNILFFDTFLDANAWMTAFATPGDIVLIENDLPDTFK